MDSHEFIALCDLMNKGLPARVKSTVWMTLKTDIGPYHVVEGQVGIVNMTDLDGDTMVMKVIWGHGDPRYRATYRQSVSKELPLSLVSKPYL